MHAGAARVGQEFAVIADQAARGRMEHQALAAGARGAHVAHLALRALGQLLDDDARVGSSSTSMMTSSIGSSCSPSIVAGRHLRAANGSSKPSRRMFSISTPSCNSPRPATSKASSSVVVA